jgi:hypothetical protein
VCWGVWALDQGCPYPLGYVDPTLIFVRFYSGVADSEIDSQNRVPANSEIDSQIVALLI